MGCQTCGLWQSPRNSLVTEGLQSYRSQRWAGTEFPSPLPLLSKPCSAVQHTASRHAVENEKLYVLKFIFHRSHCLLPSAAPKFSNTKYSSEHMAKSGGPYAVPAEISTDRESSLLPKCHDIGHVLVHCGLGSLCVSVHVHCVLLVLMQISTLKRDEYLLIFRQQIDMSVHICIYARVCVRALLPYV